MITGRPSIYSDELAVEICRRLAEGESLNRICKDESMPARSTVYEWLAIHSSFSDKYAQARNIGLDRMADELLDIADDGTNDYVERQNEDGSTFLKYDAEHVNRSRLRVDTRKWYLSKLAPKRYGERIEHVGAEGKPLIPQMSDTDLARRIAFLLTAGVTNAPGS